MKMILLLMEVEASNKSLVKENVFSVNHRVRTILSTQTSKMMKIKILMFSSQVILIQADSINLICITSIIRVILVEMSCLVMKIFCQPKTRDRFYLLIRLLQVRKMTFQ